MNRRNSAQKIKKYKNQIISDSMIDRLTAWVFIILVILLNIVLNWAGVN